MQTKKHDLVRIDGNPFGRVYHNPATGNYYPSVTTILSKRPNPKLEELREAMGAEKFDAKRDFAARRGTVMHSLLEHFLCAYAAGNSEEQALLIAQDEVERTLPEGWAKEHKVGLSLFYNFYHFGLWRNINKLVFSERFMYTDFRGGWAGAADFAFINHDGALVLWDFKSSSDMKTEADIQNYFEQVASYMFMMADSDPDKRVPDYGEILIMNELTSDVQRFRVPASDMKRHLRSFIELREQFDLDPEWIKFRENVRQTQPATV
jgi:hypothetical protein